MYMELQDVEDSMYTARGGYGYMYMYIYIYIYIHTYKCGIAVGSVLGHLGARSPVEEDKAMKIAISTKFKNCAHLQFLKKVLQNNTVDGIN